MKCVTCTAPVNIAVVKYWGKRDEDLILPINTSLSVTLDQEELCAKTTVAVSKDFEKDLMWLNGNEQPISSVRFQNVWREIKKRAAKQAAERNDEEAKNMVNWHVHIASVNNFPTAAGLASSAAGFSCLVFALAKAYGVEGEISDIARQGSGSACRSILGGFVQWETGIRSDGSDSIARQIAPHTHWPELRILVLVVSDQKKHVASTVGMQTSVETSDLLKYRIDKIVPQRAEQMKQAILKRDFDTFADLTMKDSNQLHAICMDTFPPITYMTDTSRQIVRLIHAFNQHCSELKVAYTFDAGPNACLFMMEEDLPRVINLITHFFPPMIHDLEFFFRGMPVLVDPPEDNEYQDDIAAISTFPEPGAIKYIIHTKVGGGPEVVEDRTKSLLRVDGEPTNRLI